MLRVEFQDKGDPVVMRIEGRLVGTFAEDARNLVASKKIPEGLIVDLSELTYVDGIGEGVLSWLGRMGCKFIPGNTYASYICRALGLSVARVNGKPVSGD
jgi:hypothetical protein